MTIKITDVLFDTPRGVFARLKHGSTLLDAEVCAAKQDIVCDVPISIEITLAEIQSLRIVEATVARRITLTAVGYQLVGAVVCVTPLSGGGVILDLRMTDDAFAVEHTESLAEGAVVEVCARVLRFYPIGS